MEATAMKLWEISGELEMIGALISEAEGEITPDIEAKLDAMEGVFAEKVERIALLIEERAGDAEKAKAQEDRLRAIRRCHESTVSGLKCYLERCMAAANRDRVETPNARVRRYRNSQPSIRWTRALEDLPEQYRRVTVEADTASAKQDWKDGALLPDGFTVEYGHHVRVL